MQKNIIKRALRSTIPVLAGYVVLGMGFGIILESKGYGVIWAFFMSLLIYAGSMQYAAINLITGGASLITTAITTLMVNGRHLFYGLSMVEKYKDTGKAKPYLIFALTDETYSLVCGEKKEDKSYYLFVSLFNHIYWISGSVLGAVIGSFLTFDTKGIDFALTALFITVFVEQWLSSEDHKSALIGVLSSVACLIVFKSENFLIPSMLLITLLLTFLSFFEKNKKGGN